MNIEETGVLLSKTLNESSNRTIRAVGNIGKLAVISAKIMLSICT